jgi:glutamine amidotransferase PdxT
MLNRRISGFDMTSWIAIKLLAIMFSVCTTCVTHAETQLRNGFLGSGTTWETRWHVIESDQPGPTVLIVGGVHGNEPAGYRAAQQIVHWPIVRGTLVVLPNVNRLGLAADMRWSPEFRNDRRKRDLNRNFPTKSHPEVLTPLCQAIWKFVQQQEPDWVFDLHEGFDFHRINSKSVGSSVIAFPAQTDFANNLLSAVNADVEPTRYFALLASSGPIDGSLARACGEQLAAKSFILETTFKDQSVSLRTRQHRRMVSTALLDIGLIASDCVDRLAPPAQSGVTRVALFDDAGANEAKVLRVIDNQAEFSVSHVGPKDLRPEVLKQFDVIVFPGGSGSKQGEAIGPGGRDHVRQFVSDGGGVIGICAGAFLCSSHYDWSLQLMNASVFNKMVDIPEQGMKSMWFRGPETDVDVEITAAGSKVLGIEGRQSVRFQNGPILSPGIHPALPAYEALAFFRTENGIYEAQKNTMIGAPAVVFAQFGQGRVLAISPHFESTKGAEAVVRRVIQHVHRYEE